MEGYIGVYSGVPIYKVYKKDYKPMKDTYIVLLDSNDVVLNGMIVGYWKDGLENEIIPLPKPVIFPFKPNNQKVIQKNQFEIKDNKDEMKTVQTTLYYQEEEKEEKDFWGDLLEEEEEESEEEELF